MSTVTAIISHHVVTLGATHATLQGMHAGAGSTPSLAITFDAKGPATGLSAGFHGTTEEARQFAAELVRHADVTDAAFEAALRGTGGAA